MSETAAAPPRSLLSRRVLALWLDGLIVYLFVRALAELGILVGFYVPLELTFLTVLLLSMVLLPAILGATPGKFLCGLRLSTRKSDTRPGITRLAAREWLGKPLSVVTLGLSVTLTFLLLRQLRRVSPIQSEAFLLALLPIPSLVLVYLQRRSTVHDWISGTRVLRADTPAAVGRAGIAVGLLSLLAFVGVRAFDWLYYMRVGREMAIEPGYSLPSHTRDPAVLVDFRDLPEAQARGLARWVEENARSPIEFSIEQAKEHRLLIFGERHEQRQALEFLQDLIPILYREAGINSVLMETLLAPYNEEIEEIVTASVFDRGRVLELAREMDCWGTWGFREYWDVIEVVWRLNREIPEGEAKVRLLGMGTPIDTQSLAMVGLEDNPGSNVPLSEKLRAVRLLRDLPRLNWRDEFMAREVEKAVFEEADGRGIVWVGAAHSMLNCPRPGHSRGTRGRLGFLLAQRHPGEVGQITLHHESSEAKGDSLSRFLERVVAPSSKKPLAFGVVGSPFELIRDGESLFYRDERLAFADVAQGYAFLGKAGDMKRCRWIPDYLTRRMFFSSKPFYVSWARHFGFGVSNEDDANRMFTKLNSPDRDPR